MRAYSYIIWGIVSLLGFSTVHAQEVLTLETALEQALNNNYGIQIARYSVEQAENSAYLGATGALPSVVATGGGNLGFTRATSITLNQANPETGEPTTEITGNDIATYGANAALGISYTLSAASYTQFEVLKQSVGLNQESLFLTIEQTFSQLNVAFYNLGRQLTLYELQKKSLDRSRNRLEYVKTQAELGQSNSVALLNAQVDVNADSISLAQTEAGVANAKRDLNYLIGRDVETAFTIDPTVKLGPQMELAGLQSSALAQNSSLSIADYNRKVSELNLKVARQSALPTLSISGQYAYNFSDNGPVSVLTQQSSDGLSLSGTVSFPIFNGSQIKRNVQNAEIGVASTQSSYKQTEQQVILDLNKAYATYQNNLRVLQLSETSLEAAQLNFVRTQEAFELGQANGVQYREAQLNLARVENQLNDLRFNVKQSEIELLRLSGQLVQQNE